MGYVDMQYTGPEWTNNAPPPVNASNLLDIGHALEAVNITQEERSALGAETTDKLGQILTHIVESINGEVESSISSIQTQVNEKGNCIIVSGSYVGNGGSLQLTIPPINGRYVKCIIIFSNMDTSSSSTNGYTRFSYTVENASYMFITMNSSCRNLPIQSFSNGALSMASYANAPNLSGVRYYYIALG